MPSLTPDGVNINHNCGSTHMDELREFTKERNANLGLAFDGDADRCLACDENGNLWYRIGSHEWIYGPHISLNK